MNKYDKQVDIKRDFTDEEIIKTLLDLGSEDYKQGPNGELIFQTVCHNKSNGSYKLYYYQDTGMFHCYTECGDSFNLYDLVMRAKGYTEFKDAYSYVYGLLGLRKAKRIGFVSGRELIDDWDIFLKYSKANYHQEKYCFRTYPQTLINYYCKIDPIEWLDEGITQETLEKYMIRYDLTGNKIVIPHYDIDGNLIGIRGRALNKFEVEQGKKYMPLIIENEILRHPTHYNLYGLNMNKKAIEQTKKIMIFESEKSVLKCDGFYGRNNFTVASCGSNISNYQRNMIINLGVSEVFIAFDKEYHEAFSKESDDYSEKILKLAYKFSPYVTTWVLWDTDNLLGYKDAPCDKGEEVLRHLMKNKFEVATREE